MTTPVAQWALAYTAVAQWAVPGSKPGRPNVHLVLPSTTISEQQDAPLLARVYTKANVLAVPSDVAQVLVRVYDRDGAEVYGEELSAGAVIQDPAFGTPTNPDARWTADGDGGNLDLTIPGRGVFLAGGANYGTEVVVEYLDGDSYTISGHIRVKPTRTYKQDQAQ